MRSSGLPQLAAAFPPRSRLLPERNSGKGCRQHERLTAAGTAPDFTDSYRGHRIPFCCEPFSVQI